MKLESCPCCGYRTIEERGNYDICKVCWWEDDGQDNEQADEAFSGPNYGISLVEGRCNYLIHGLYDPERTDLRRLKEEESKYAQGRKFEILDNEYLVEIGTDWNWKIAFPSLE